MNQLSPIIGLCSVFYPRSSSGYVSKTYIKIIRMKFAQLIFYILWQRSSLHWMWGEEKLLSHVWPFVTPWTIQSMEFSRPEYWEWVAFPFSRGSAPPRNQTQIFCITGRFFTSWATNYPKTLCRVHYCPSTWQACHTEIQQGSSFDVIALLCSSGNW